MTSYFQIFCQFFLIP